jgi:hypothetical protein
LRRIVAPLGNRADLLRRLAVSCDVHDAPVALEQRVDDAARIGARLRRILGTDQRFHLVAIERPG